MGGPIGGFAGGFIGSVLGEIAVPAAADFSRERLENAIRRFRPPRNADLERAQLEALRNALNRAREELRQQTSDTSNLPRGLSPEEERLFNEWEGRLAEAIRGGDAQVFETVGEQSFDAPALETSPRPAIADWLLNLLQRLTEPTPIPSSLSEFLKTRLPDLFRHEFAQLLKDPQHQRAWIAFQKQMLDATLQALRETQQLTPEIAQGVQLLQERHEQFTRTFSEWLESEPDRWQERARELAHSITEPILHAIRDTRERVEFIVNLLGEKHRYRLLHEGTLRFLQAYTQEIFVGRHDILANLEAFLTTRSSGTAVVHAPAGYGKTRLMMKLLNRLQARGDTDVAFHFFSTREELGGLGTRVEYAYAHLLLQLGHITSMQVYLPDNNPDELRAQLLYQIRELKPPRKRLVLLIDALDEADAPILYPPLPDTLPDGIFVIVSARWDNRPEPPPYLEAWLRRADAQFALDALSEDDLREWVSNIEPLRAYADDPDFISQLHQRTEGLTLYARYLLEDLQESPDPKQALQNAPRGMQEYIQRQIRQLASHVSNAQGIRRMFALLTVVKAPLPESDLETLCEVSVWDLQNLPQPVRRWFLCSEAGWQFAHPLLAIEFRNALGGEAEWMEQALLNHCARWKEHKSGYALRHYSTHLMERAPRDKAAAEALYTLALDDNFLQAQREAFPTEPDLLLKPLQQAIQVASQRDEAVILTQLMLRHAQIVEATRSTRSPYEIWRTTGNLEHALKVADMYEARIRTLWYLMLAEAQPDREQRKVVLERLTESSVLSLERRWHQLFASALLQLIAEDIEKGFLEKLKSLLPDHCWTDIERSFTEETAQAPEEESEVELETIDLYQRAEAQVKRVKRLAQSGQREEALRLFAETLGTTSRIVDAYTPIWALAAIAEARARSGQREQAEQVFGEALAAARVIVEPYWRANALTAIAESLALVGQREEAQQIFDEALKAYPRIETATCRGVWESALRAEALAREGQREQAIQLFDEAVNVVRGVPDIEKHIGARVIAQEQARAGLFADAVNTAQLLAGKYHEVFPRVAKAMVEAGDRQYYKQLLLPCAYFRLSALRMCAVLIRAYPEQAEAIGKVVLEAIGGGESC